MKSKQLLNLAVNTRFGMKVYPDLSFCHKSMRYFANKLFPFYKRHLFFPNV